MSRLATAAGLFLLAGVLGCGGKKAQPPIPVCGPAPCQPDGKPFDLNGRFGVFARVYADVSAADGLFTPTGLEASFLLLGDIVQQGNQTELGFQACEINLPEVPLPRLPRFILRLPRPLVDSIGVVHATGLLDGTTTCAELLQPKPFVLLAGVKMHDQMMDPIPGIDTQSGEYTACGGTLIPCANAPTPDSGACICDQEADGILGSTVLVENAPVITPPIDEVYEGVKITIVLEGTAHSSDLLAGTIRTTIDQKTVGCRHQGGQPCALSLLTTVQSVAPVITQADAEEDSCLASTFTGKRVPAATDCTALIAMKETLFAE